MGIFKLFDFINDIKDPKIIWLGLGGMNRPSTCKDMFLLKSLRSWWMSLYRHHKARIFMQTLTILFQYLRNLLSKKYLKHVVLEKEKLYHLVMLRYGYMCFPSKLSILTLVPLSHAKSLSKRIKNKWSTTWQKQLKLHLTFQLQTCDCTKLMYKYSWRRLHLICGHATTFCFSKLEILR